MITVGIDLSLSSPGMCIFDPCAKIVYCFFLPSRRKDIPRRFDCESPWSGGCQICVRVLKPYPPGVTGDQERYEHVTTELVERIKACHQTGVRTNIFMEGYAFGCRGSAHSYKLAELTGILKQNLFREGLTVVSVPPTQVKKSFSGKGSATKVEMYRVFHTRVDVDLLRRFEMLQCKGVPNPVQDIVDAFAVMEYGRDQDVDTTHDSKRRRIHVHFGSGVAET